MVSPSRSEFPEVLSLAAGEAGRYLRSLATSPVVSADAVDDLATWVSSLPVEGVGAAAAVRELAARADVASTRSAGPRFFHFVVGGVTPAALAADWLASTYDQNAYSWVSSSFGSWVESVALDWLKSLFSLPDSMQGFLVSDATMANFTGLAAARGWWASKLGVDVAEDGFVGLPAPSIVSSGYVHASAVKALGMLGFGRGTVRRFALDAVGRADLAGIESALRSASAPSIILATAGEVNAGDFDPLAALADLAEQYGAWLHVDAAFGLFGRLASSSRPLTEGIERADSIGCDGHKWLNVPYDCGFGFVRDASLLVSAFNVGAPYLKYGEGSLPNPGFLVPEMSRRARSLAVWATLRAYGRSGVTEMVERHLLLAQHLAALVDASKSFERLADVPLNIVCFRARPPGLPESELDDLNTALGADLLRDGTVFAGTTVYAGKVAFRPAIVNWRTTEADVELLLDKLVELLGRRLQA